MDDSNTENIIIKLSEASNKMFNSFKRGGFLTKKQMENFGHLFKKATLASYTLYLRTMKDFVISQENQ